MRLSSSAEYWDLRGATMLFEVFGPFELPRQKSGLVDVSREAKREFVDEVEDTRGGLTGAHGCYVFGIAGGRGTLPWYVGKAERLSFSREVFSPSKLVHYNDVLANRDRGKPVLYLIARTTPKGRFCKPASNKTVPYLETMLIGICMRRNAELRNKRDTKLLKELRVRGLFNANLGHPGRSAVRLKAALGMN
jgi:hypothetical protein